MYIWINVLKKKAKNTIFVKNDEFNKEIITKYKILKNLLCTFQKNLESIYDLDNIKYDYKIDELKIKRIFYSYKNLLIFLDFYEKSEKLIVNLLHENFKKSFYDNIEFKKDFFIYLNKIFRLFFYCDHLLKKYQIIFADFSLYKIFKKTQNDKISILSAIPYPMGRMVLSLFYNNDISLYYPNIFLKRTKIILNTDNEKFLVYYNEISKILKLDFMNIYFSSIFLYYNNSRIYNNLLDKKYVIYIRTLKSNL